MTASPSSDNPRAQRLVRVLLTVAVVARRRLGRLPPLGPLQLAPGRATARAASWSRSPDVSGLIAAVPIRDNQSVAAGTLLLVDRARFDLAVRRPRPRSLRSVR
jgi:multidrug resistance efflux pump